MPASNWEMATEDPVVPVTSSLGPANAAPKRLRNLFQPPPPDKCTRCGNRVYQVEKVGPVNEVIFHKQCFKCKECGQHLSLKTYFTNPTDFNDREIYCNKHCPKVRRAREQAAQVLLMLLRHRRHRHLFVAR